MNENTIHQSTRSRFDAYDVALQAVVALRPIAGRVRRHDPSLYRQMQRAADSMVLNLGEGSYNEAGTRLERFRSASGSANEVSAALDLAVAWGHAQPAQVAEAQELLDRVRAMLWRLTRGR